MKRINFYQKKYEALETFRYSRCGKKISEQFKNRLEMVISKVKTLDLQEYGMTDEEIKVFNEEVEEVETLIM